MAISLFYLAGEPLYKYPDLQIKLGGTKEPAANKTSFSLYDK